MSVIDYKYSKILDEVLFKGFKYEDPNRKGVFRKQITSANVRFDFKDGFPIMSLRKIYYKGAINELICFLNGYTDVSEYWKRGVNFWDKDVAKFNNISVEELRNGGSTDMGLIYPHQWRNDESDQIVNLIYKMIHNPMSTELIVNSWDYRNLKNMCLPPCHYSFQVVCFPVDGTYEFELHWAQRSTDLFLGFPTNIIFYSVLCKLLEVFTGYKARAVCADLKNVHLYDNQMSAAIEISTDRYFGRYNSPTFRITESLTNTFEDFKEEIKSLSFQSFSILIGHTLEDLTEDMFIVEDYESYPPIKVEMLSYSETTTFKKGDKVNHPDHGEGVITYKRECGHPYPFIVEFKTIMRSFTLDGRERKEENPTLTKSL